MRVTRTQRQKLASVRASVRGLCEVAGDLPVLIHLTSKEQCRELSLGWECLLKHSLRLLDSPLGLNLFASKFQPFTLNTFVLIRCPQYWSSTISLRLKRLRSSVLSLSGLSTSRLGGCSSPSGQGWSEWRERPPCPFCPVWAGPQPWERADSTTRWSFRIWGMEPCEAGTY